MIPDEVLEDFLTGKIPKGDSVHMIDANELWEGRYRVNVWVNENIKGCIWPKTYIGHSYFMKYSDGVLEDRTIQPSGAL
jgi:hypothetical protein